MVWALTSRRYGRAGFILVAGLLLSACTSVREPTLDAASGRPPPDALAHPPGLPDIGKWMYDARHEPAHWLGELHQGKSLREPINILILDTVAQSADEARERLQHQCAVAGYAIRGGHSTGYQGYIGGAFYEQLPEGKHTAFANQPFELGNDHGRLFGPLQFRNAWLFLGAFSRESLDPLDRVKHRYVSFNRARDHFAQHLDTRTNFKISAFVNLDNALINDAACTTGDHDGVAVLLSTSPR